MTRRLPALVRAAAGLLAAACLLAGAARAEVSGSASVVSDYRYRGVSLSNGEPAAQVDLNYDDRSGAYAGAFVSNVRLGTPPAALVQWVPYGGASLRLANGVALDAGASYSGFSNGNLLGYFEAHAGLAFDEFRLQLHYSPDYFKSDVRTLYTQLDASHPLSGAWRVFVHLGELEPLSGLPGETPASLRQFDARAGVALSWSAFSLRLSWVGVDRVAYLYPVLQYDGALQTRRDTWVLQFSAAF